MNSFLRLTIFALILLAFSAVNAQYPGPETGYGAEVGEVDATRYDGNMNDGAEIRADRKIMDTKDELFDLTKGKKIVLDGITFETNQAMINPTSETILEKVRQSMAANPDMNVTIIGHSDNVGNEEYNRGLSQKRAQAVKDWLVKNNISDSRMKVIGKGEMEPTATNDTKEGRAINRRIEFMVE